VTSFLCDHCDSEYPAGCPGSTMVVAPDGRTKRFCSQACLRADVNRTPYQSTMLTMASWFVAGMLTEVVLTVLVRTFQR